MRVYSYRKGRDKAQEGGDIATVQELLGHHDVATTRHYVHVTRKDLRTAMEKQLSAQNPQNNKEGTE